jgi:alpha-D-ribose 1-methylphosphonate 5-triphosphate diphosphatase
MTTDLLDVLLVPGAGKPAEPTMVRLDHEGTVVELEPSGPGAACSLSELPVLLPAPCDLHLDVVAERRRPRATVVLDLERVVLSLDAECAVAGIATLLISARCEEEPGKGVHLADAAELCATVERLAPQLMVDWWVHARVETTDEGATAALEDCLGATGRIALISVMEHSAERTRFASEREHVEFYARDWGMPVDEVEQVMVRKRRGAEHSDERRRAAASIARAAGVPLASHDDRTAQQVEAAATLGATVSEFPLTREAADAAASHGLVRVLGAPNVVRGRSTSPGNLLASEAVAEGRCDALCSDYLPSALGQAPFTLAASGTVDLGTAAQLISDAPRRALGWEATPIEVGRPLDAALIDRSTSVGRCVGLWRAGRRTFAG